MRLRDVRVRAVEGAIRPRRRRCEGGGEDQDGQDEAAERQGGYRFEMPTSAHAPQGTGSMVMR